MDERALVGFDVSLGIGNPEFECRRIVDDVEDIGPFDRNFARNVD